MTPEEHYAETKEKTDRIVEIYTDWLTKNKGGSYLAIDMPQYAPTDYLVMNGSQPKFYLEVKFRNHEKGHYLEEKAPIGKMAYAYLMKDLEKIPSYFMVVWKDTVGIINLLKFARVNNMLARADRGTGEDLYVFYNHEDFNELRDVYFSYISVV
jgi:hypothetical protein